MLENIVETAKNIDYRVLDELNTPECELAVPFKRYLSTLESISYHW